jgi:glucokinase
VMGTVADQDAPVREAIEDAASNIAIGVANVITTVHPDLVVIGGGVAKLGEILLERIRTDVRCRVGHLFPADDIRIEPSQLGAKAGVLGAIALASRGLPE